MFFKGDILVIGLRVWTIVAVTNNKSSSRLIYNSLNLCFYSALNSRIGLSTFPRLLQIGDKFYYKLKITAHVNKNRCTGYHKIDAVVIIT